MSDSPEWGLLAGLLVVASAVGWLAWWVGGRLPARPAAIFSIVAGGVGAVILVIPFLGVFAAVLLDPASVALGARVRSSSEGSERRLAGIGLALGSAALLLLAVFLLTGAYSESAR